MDSSALVYERNPGERNLPASMANVNNSPNDNPREVVESIRGIRELFHGRFTDPEIATLYDINGRNKTRTVMFILQTEPADLSQLLEDQQNGWTIVRRKRPLVPRDVLEKAKSGMINTSARQFACRPCDKSWWKMVPERKKVSKCQRCHVKYDPVPRDKEWGWAEFHCTFCGNQFGGFCQMSVPSQCYQCHQPVLPTRVLPPNPNRQRKTRSTHSCDACRGRGRGQGRCAHPTTRRANQLPNILHPSQPHDSTGSTVDTFLPQDDLGKDYHAVLSAIPEEDDAGSDQGNAGSDNDDDVNGS